MSLRLRDKRMAKGLSCVEIAKILNISTSYNYKIESVARNTGPALSFEIAEFFNCHTIDELKDLFYIYERYSDYKKVLTS
jgi:transcriptional regulator with XRE-family HTH domain